MSDKIDDIWASMNEGMPKHVVNFEKLARPSKSQHSKPVKKVTAKTAASQSEKAKKAIANPETIVEEVFVANAVSECSYLELQALVTKEVNNMNDESGLIRRRGLTNLQKLLFIDNRLTAKDYSEAFRDLCRPIFKRFADSIEKCRELAQRITRLFFERASDLVPVLAYYFPAMMQRIPSGLAYDEELKVFVTDIEAHNAYKRGKAVERQDKAGAISGQSTVIVEPSEEIRLLVCEALAQLIDRVRVLQAFPILHPYFEDLILFLQVQLRDPYPDLKLTACLALEQLARVEDFEIGIKFYAIALCRAVLPTLRHRRAKVRVAAVNALHHVMIVPDRAKRKAAGSEAIMDLVGFREENILPIAAFYTDDIQVNYLAELVADKSPLVREKLVTMLTSLLTVIGDRYDHQTRLLPYLLDLMTDEVEEIANAALQCLQVCGRQYEEEHSEDIIERRQLGVDGDHRINLDDFESSSWPRPFTSRPRLGMRLYVRGNSKRFLFALVNELTNWIAPTRLKSANLFKLLVVLCEEHLTMEAHMLLPQLIKALKFARDDKDHALHTSLLAAFALLGRYMLPEVYLYYILPRLRGDNDVVAFGVDAETRIAVMEMLSALLSGSKASQMVLHFDELVTLLTDSFIINNESMKLQLAAGQVIIVMLKSLQGKGQHVVAAHYLSTGRLSSLQGTIRKLLRHTLLLQGYHNQQGGKEVAAIGNEMLSLLAHLESDNNNSIDRLMQQHGHALLMQEMNAYDIDPAWSTSNSEHQVILRLLEHPSFPIQRSERSAQAVLAFILQSVGDLNSVDKLKQPQHQQLSSELENELALSMLSMLNMLLAPYIDAENGLQEVTNVSIQTRMEEILDIMVISSRWSRTVALSGKRLDFLQMLVESATTFFVAIEEIVVRKLTDISKAVLPVLLTPSAAEAHRLQTIAVFQSLIAIAQIYCGASRVVSYTKLSQNDAEVQGKFEQVQQVVQFALNHLLQQTLQDASDCVRCGGLELLLQLAIFTRETDFCSISAALFKLICIDLEREKALNNRLTQLDFIDLADTLLRSIAVLDPTKFEAVIRNELDFALKDVLSSEEVKEKVTELASGLINHVDLLQSL